MDRLRPRAAARAEAWLVSAAIWQLRREERFRQLAQRRRSVARAHRVRPVLEVMGRVAVAGPLGWRALLARLAARARVEADQ